MRRAIPLVPPCIVLLVLAAVAGGCASRSAPRSTPLYFSERYLRVRYGHDVRALLRGERFDRLERLADSLERHDVRWPSGRSRLASLHQWGFGEVDEPGTPEAWERQLALLREWTEARPDSRLARLALVEGLAGRAWAARGHGWARNVSADRWRRYASDLEDASRRLGQVPPEERRGYAWYDVNLSVLHSSGDDSLFRRVAAEALRRYPDQPDFYLDVANHLLPRWYGEPGDWQAFADTATAGLPDSIAEEFYARIVLMAASCGEDVFSAPAADWPRARRGLERWQRHWPLALLPRSGRALLACLAQDRTTARAAFAVLGDTVDLDAWGSARRYEAARRWVARTRD